MKKKNVYKFLFAASALLILGFMIRFGVDIYRYDVYKGSAPLYAYALLRAVEFVVPSILIFIIGMIVKKKYGGK